MKVSAICPECHGAGELIYSGRSISPSSGVRVFDRQYDEPFRCDECDGAGVVPTDVDYEMPEVQDRAIEELALEDDPVQCTLVDEDGIALVVGGSGRTYCIDSDGERVR